MKILLALNSFKDSCNSIEANTALRKGLLNYYDANHITMMPLFDGGDGSIDGLLFYKGYQKINVSTVNALGKKIKTYYLIEKNTNIAYIEMAKASGIAIIGKKNNKILQANTFGTGILIKHAISKKVAKIIVMIGGSATNDAGIGALAALGIQFENKSGKILEPNAYSLKNISRISGDIPIPITIEIWTDVLNPFTGDKGAVAIFSEQKGAGKNEKIELEKGMLHFRDFIKRSYAIDLDKIKGTGAAGGFGAGLLAVLGCTMHQCTPRIFEMLDIENLIKDHDIIITGEGSLDHQSTYGKLVHGVCTLARKYQKPIIGICGNNILTVADQKKLGLKAVFSILKGPSDLNSALKYWESNLIYTGCNLGAILQIGNL